MGIAKSDQLATKSPKRLQTRYFTVGRSNHNENRFTDTSSASESHSDAQMEATARRARQTFAETLPPKFLTPEEYKIYERLYGPPVRETRPEDISLLQDFEEDIQEEEAEEEKIPKNTIFREDAQGRLKEVVYERLSFEEVTRKLIEKDPNLLGEMENSPMEERDLSGNVATETGNDWLDTAPQNSAAMGEEEAVEIEDLLEVPNEADFEARLALYKDTVYAKQAAELQDSVSQELESEEEDDMVEEIGEASEDLGEQQGQDEDSEDFEGFEDSYENSDTIRSHPFTSAGRFSTSPATLEIPKDTVVDPIASLLSDASNKHLKEVAQKAFGGPHLPNSTATPSAKQHMQQQAIALDAAKFRMSDMEANVYMVANLPGIYAIVMSALIEVRKRVGSEWVRDLLKKDGGPVILDAGGGGAGVLAWQDILRAESELMYGMRPVNFGKSTVVVGSPALRDRASRLLENTTFLPRLPDYNPSLNHPSQENPSASPRKRYDIIVAPHTLWTIKQDYMRKSHVENLWSLLNPNGGILVLIEKGVPRGFELIAGAREMLLKHHIASPESPIVENQIEEPFEGRFRDKETGMIIAPCTNHFKCPLYLSQGQSKGRKDLCHFSQRFLRPHFLQRVLGAKDINHEDIRFSYIAVQRGVDQRQSLGILQGPTATETAFIGYEEKKQAEGETSEMAHEPESAVSNFHPLSLPRAVMPPLKRRGHVILDLCTPSGKIERWTVPRSFSKQAYRDARKSRWGDLWALGAKTRIARNIRLGINKQESGSKHVSRPRRAEDGSDNLRQVQRGKVKSEKRTKNGRTLNPLAELGEDFV